MDSILEHSACGRSDDIDDLQLDALLGEVCHFLGANIEKKGAEITSDDLPTIRASNGLIFQLLLNLIGNSLKYVRPNARPQIHIAHERDENWVKIGVRDNGVGMSEDDLKLVQQPLMRGASSEGTEGVGLGLSLAKNIIEELAGELRIESELGQGTCVWLNFPHQILSP